ncbi:glutathione S-transferase T2-like [Rhododendron vialii]|uniref:glutathione S-transferase T2-like n=1 Tax=Rhododendron vialii TaxID=182163 RepID=UPI00265E9A97|nr:glutathione S-transferase T2-like [Rhododendron vialii]
MYEVNEITTKNVLQLELFLGVAIAGMDQRHDGYFTNLMESDSDLHEEQFVMESQCLNPNAQVFTQETQFTAEMGSIPKKPPRGGNFTMEEDKLLKKTAFWLRVKDYFDEHKRSVYNRTSVSLLNRWSTIQQCTNKFCNCYAKVDLLNQSGLTEENKISKAKEMYEGNVGSSFQFDHCWVLLKNQPKWLLDSEKKNQLKRPRIGTSSGLSTPDTINLRDNNVAMDNFVDVEQPAGRKGEKERSFQEQPMKLMKRKNKDITSSTQIAGALDEIKECKTKLVEKKLEMLGKTCDQEEEKIRIKKERLEMDKFKEDERVMMMDLNGLSEEQQEFYMYRKMEILEKRRLK